VTQAITLYGADTGNCLRAAIALEEAGLAYIAKPVDLAKGEQREPPLLAVNPEGKVPVLVDHSADGPPFILTQSNAIVFHAAAAAPGRRLLPDSRLDRARVLERYFHFLTDAIAPSHAGFFLRLRQQTVAAHLIDEHVLARLAAAGRFVAGRPYMAGDRFSIADIAAFTILLPFLPQLNGRTDRPLIDWHERIAARPAVQRGLGAFRSTGTGPADRVRPQHTPRGAKL
jgi:GST-like protein